MFTYRLDLTEIQLEQLEGALDAYARIGMQCFLAGERKELLVDTINQVASGLKYVRGFNTLSPNKNEVKGE